MSDLHLVKPPNEDEAKKQEQAKRTELVKPEDGTLARQYVKATEGKLAYFHSDWHAYENGFWKVTSVEKINLSVMHFLEKYPRRGFRVTTSLTKRITEAVQWIIKLEDEEIDRKMSEGRHYINLRNGLYNLETHQLEAHQPGFYFTYQLGFAPTPK